MAEKNKKTIRTNGYYTGGSAAYKVDPYIYEEEEKEQKQIKPVAHKRAGLIHRFKFVAAIALVFAGCIAIMVPHTMIEQQNNINNSLRDELSALKGENISLEADIANKVNLEYVEQEATARLGMSKPQSYQIGYIDVPKKSYNVQYDVEEEETSSGFAFAGLGALFKKD